MPPNINNLPYNLIAEEGQGKDQRQTIAIARSLAGNRGKKKEKRKKKKKKNATPK
jgi:hypothetical protein